jgi:hypothetical protein
MQKSTSNYEAILREANELRCQGFTEGSALHHALADLKMHELDLLERAECADERQRPAIEAASRVRCVVETSMRLELELRRALP